MVAWWADKCQIVIPGTRIPSRMVGVDWGGYSCQSFGSGRKGMYSLVYLASGDLFWVLSILSWS